MYEVRSGVVITHAASFPIWEIDLLEARQSLPGRMFDYGDITILAGPSRQTFGKLHPFGNFMSTYGAYRRMLTRWAGPDGRFLPRPAQGRLPQPPGYEPGRERDGVVDGG